ncbi:hypothetical protein Tco_1471145 [Tanacetum coccineum]
MGLYKEVNEMKEIFTQMENEVDQCSVEKKYFKIEKIQLLINNDRLLEDNIPYDVMCTFLSSLHRVDNCASCKSLEIELLNQQESNKSFNELSKSDQISENAKLRAQLQTNFSGPKVKQDGTSVNTKFAKHSTSENRLYVVTPFLKTQFIPKVVQSHFTLAYQQVHQDYLKVTKEHIETLQELLEQARALKPSNLNLDYACKFAQRIQ